MKRGLVYVLSASLIVASGILSADVLLVDSIANAPPNTDQGIPRPSRGMSMQMVKNRFGSPTEAHPRVGTPPITRWDYPDYSVFFEHQYVLTSVLHHQ